MSRLGFNGPEEVKNHPWLADFPFDKLYRRKIDPPFVPNSGGDNYDHKYNNQETVLDTKAQIEMQNAILLRNESTQSNQEAHSSDFFLQELLHFLQLCFCACLFLISRSQFRFV